MTVAIQSIANVFGHQSVTIEVEKIEDRVKFIVVLLGSNGCEILRSNEARFFPQAFYE